MPERKDLVRELQEIRQEIEQAKGHEWAWNSDLAQPLARFDAVLEEMA